MAIELREDDGGIAALVDPERGGAITSISLPDGRQVLSTVTAAMRDRIAGAAGTDPSRESEARWMLASSGGWEVMAPNAGAAGKLCGLDYPFHGTAGRSQWRIREVSRRETHMSTDSPIGLHSARRIRLTSASCTVTEELRNGAGAPRAAAWGSHLAFGQDMLKGNVEIDCNVRVLGGALHGTDQPSGVLERWVRHPCAGSSGLVYLDARVARGEVRLVNESQRVRATVRWDPSVYPYLWIWGECGGTTGWPWFGEARALGIEPVSSWPAAGVPALQRTTRTHVILDQGEGLSATVCLELDWRDNAEV